MRARLLHVGAVLSAALVFGIVSSGCGQTPSDQGRVRVENTAQAKKVHDHSDWWCEEHGIPEKECSMCSTKVASEFKKKGDWCDKHNRAMSQCFLCKPERKEFYAAKYRVKYGKEPPPIKEFEDQKDQDKTDKDSEK